MGRKFQENGRMGNASFGLACIALISYNCLECNQASWGDEVIRDLRRDFRAASTMEAIDGLLVGPQEAKSWENEKLHHFPQDRA